MDPDYNDDGVLPTGHRPDGALGSVAAARPAAEPTRYRSGAVARMLRMPVATLRIWERRYQVAAPVTTSSGHRLYSAADVQRLALLRQLTSLGHAIGTLAGLDMAALHQVAATHASTMAGLATRPSAAAAAPPAPLSVVVIGQALALRLRQPGLVRRWPRPLQIQRVYADLEEACGDPMPAQADLALVRLPGLREALVPLLQRFALACGAGQVGVLYHYGSATGCQALASAGMPHQREPSDDTQLAAWVVRCAGGMADAATGGRGNGPGAVGLPSRAAEPGDPDLDHAVAGAVSGGEPRPVPPRRYDDATLTELAGLSSTIACECPRHVAELLMQLSQFEAYSAECASRSPQDAELHAYLNRVAGASRAMFEAALERVAVLEGLVLPQGR